MYPNTFSARVADEMVSDRIRAAEHQRLASEVTRPVAARRSPLALLARLRPARHRAAAQVPASAEVG